MEIFGLAGTNGSGKDSLADLLGNEHGYLVVSATDILRQELERRGLPTDRVHKSSLSAEWRRQFGMAVLVDKAYKLYLSQKSNYQGMIVGSLRHPGEADKIHELGGKVIWVDADPIVRYDRIQLNDRGRLEDQKTFEQFLADEQREMHPEGDEATLNGAAVKDRADIFISNDSNDLKTFYAEVRQALNLA